MRAELRKKILVGREVLDAQSLVDPLRAQLAGHGLLPELERHPSQVFEQVAQLSIDNARVMQLTRRVVDQRDHSADQTRHIFGVTNPAHGGLLS